MNQQLDYSLIPEQSNKALGEQAKRRSLTPREEIMQSGKPSNSPKAYDLHVSDIPNLDNKELSDLITDWLASLDDMVAEKQVKKAMLTAASLIQLVRGRTAKVHTFPKLVLLVVRLSGLLGNERIQNEHLDVYFDSLDPQLANSELDQLLEFSLLFVINYQEIDKRLLDIGPSKFTHSLISRPRLAESNAKVVKHLFSEMSLFKSKLDVIGTFMILIEEETSETQRILLKSCLYGYLCMNPFSDRQSTAQEVMQTLKRLLVIGNWSTELKYLIEEELVFYSRLSSAPAKTATIEVRRHSLVTKSRTFLNFIALNSYQGQVNRCVELLHRLILSPLERGSIPELCSYVEGEIATVVSLGLAKNRSSLHSENKEHLSASALNQLSPAIKAITRGDFDFAEQFLSLREKQSEDSATQCDHLKQLTRALVSSIDPFATYTSIADRHEIGRSSLDSSYFPVQASLIDHFLTPGISSLITTSNLLAASGKATTEERMEAYSLAKGELRSVHRIYGSRNFLFMSISILILQYEITNFPLKAIERIDSLFNLFKLVDFDNSAVISTMHLDKINVSRKLGNDSVVAEHSMKLSNIALREEDEQSYAIALKHQLDSHEKLNLGKEKIAKLISSSIFCLTQYSARLDPNVALELNIAVVRELIQLQEWNQAEAQLDNLLAMSPEDTSSSNKRVIFNYVALVSSKLGKYDVEADAWRKLSMISSSDTAGYYTLQEARAKNLYSRSSRKCASSDVQD